MNGGLGYYQCVGKGEERQEVYERLRELEQDSRRVSSAEELEALEREIRGCTDTLASLLLERPVQASLDAEAQREKEAELIRNRPAKMKNEGCEGARIRTVSG
jgi:predicted  nucleic acid-binding Zn-ribbon protein